MQRSLPAIYMRKLCRGTRKAVLMWKVALFAAVLFTATTADAAPPRDDLLVTSGWLASHAGDKDVVILHVGTDAGYQTGHIPGARLVKDNLSVNTPEGLTMEVPSADVLRQKMEALGISDNSHIVVYNENSEFQRGTRVMLSLDAAGFGDRSMLLDGGLAEWKKEGHAVATDATQIAQGHLSPLKMQPIVVDYELRAVAHQVVRLRSDRCPRGHVLWRAGGQARRRRSYSRRQEPALYQCDEQRWQAQIAGEYAKCSLQRATSRAIM